MELADIFNLKLERHAGNTLKKKKVVSISKKYPSIPHEFKSYYPVIPDEENEVKKEDDHQDDDNSIIDVIAVGPKSAPEKIQKPTLTVKNLRKVGRPKQSIVKTPTKSILSFFPKLDKKST